LNKYETIFIINPNIESENVERIIEDVQNLITGSEGEVIKVDKWGKKRLAYEVKGNRDGFYVLINFEADPQFILRLGRYYSLTDEIIKNMTVRAERPSTEFEGKPSSDDEEDDEDIEDDDEDIEDDDEDDEEDE
jgi:small subunit ribosomal protein S6